MTDKEPKLALHHSAALKEYADLIQASGQQNWPGVDPLGRKAEEMRALAKRIAQQVAGESVTFYNTDASLAGETADGLVRDGTRTLYQSDIPQAVRDNARRFLRLGGAIREGAQAIQALLNRPA